MSTPESRGREALAYDKTTWTTRREILCDRAAGLRERDRFWSSYSRHSTIQAQENEIDRELRAMGAWGNPEHRQRYAKADPPVLDPQPELPLGEAQ